VPDLVREEERHCGVTASLAADGGGGGPSAGGRGDGGHRGAPPRGGRRPAAGRAPNGGSCGDGITELSEGGLEELGRVVPCGWRR
jgi:hypothetical protein